MYKTNRHFNQSYKEQTMKRLLAISPLLFLLVAVGGCDSGNSKTKSMEQLHRERGVPVRVEVISNVTQAGAYSCHAVLEGGRESTASALVADRVEQIKYRVGDHVNKNAVVVTFPTDNPAASYHQAKVAFEHSRTTLERMTSLYESGGISLQELDNVRTQHRVSEANWNAAREAINVDAPITGIITRINVRESQNVKPDDALFTVGDTRTLRARLLVTEANAGLMRVGDPAEAEYAGKTLKGRIVQVDRSMDSKKQAYGVMVEFSNPGNTVASGSNAQVRIPVENTGTRLMLARKDVQRQDDEYYVFVVSGDDAVRKPVSIGSSIGTSVEILDGLQAGDTLITASQMLLEDGSRIRIVD